MLASRLIDLSMMDCRKMHTQHLINDMLGHAALLRWPGEGITEQGLGQNAKRTETKAEEKTVTKEDDGLDHGAEGQNLCDHRIARRRTELLLIRGRLLCHQQYLHQGKGVL